MISVFSPAVRMSNLVIKDNHFVSLKRMYTTDNAANTIFLLLKGPLSSMEDVFKTLNLPDDNGIFRIYTDITKLYNRLKFISLLFIQNIFKFLN